MPTSTEKPLKIAAVLIAGLAAFTAYKLNTGLASDSTPDNMLRRTRARLYLRAEPNQQATALRLLQPSTVLTLQSLDLKNGYNHIRTDDDVNGWVDAGYLEMHVPPASFWDGAGIVGLMFCSGLAGAALAFVFLAQGPWDEPTFVTPTQVTDNDLLKAYIPVGLEEYKTLRDESKQTSINMFTAIQLGAALVGVILASGFTQWTLAPLASASVFFVLAPLACSIVWIVWVGEALRFNRVGFYLRSVERSINAVLAKQDTSSWLTVKDPKQPLSWEQWLAKGGHLKSVYFMRLVVFLLILLISVVIGVTGATQAWSRSVTVSPAFLHFLTLAWFCIGIMGGTGAQWAWFMVHPPAITAESSKAST